MPAGVARARVGRRFLVETGSRAAAERADGEA
jgi:hypothetical protein